MKRPLKLDEDLCLEAQVRAAHEGVSLSAWIGALIRGEVPRRQDGGSLLAALGSDEMKDREFETERDPSGIREVDF